MSDNKDHCVKVFDMEGKLLYKIGKEVDGDGEFKLPLFLSMSKAGELIVCDAGNHRVQLFKLNGKFVTKFGKKKGGGGGGGRI